MQNTTLAYDIENRVVSATGSAYPTPYEYYAYTPDNKRIWKKKPNGSEEFYFYGISGQKLGTYAWGGEVDTNVYFGSKLIVSRGVLVAAQDRLGSIGSYYPYGEERQVTAQDRDKFATYYRDGTTGLDYARNRYYVNTLGRFLSPDPYRATTGPSDPQSWNQYAYVSNDPINYYDPYGLFQCNPNSPECNPPIEHPKDPPKARPVDVTPREPWGASAGGGGRGGSSTWQEKWDALSEDCQNGLRTAMPKTAIRAMLSALAIAIAKLGDFGFSQKLGVDNHCWTLYPNTRST